MSRVPVVMHRRTWLAAAGATVLLSASGCTLLPPIPKRPAPTLDDARGWLRLSDSGVEFWCPRVEMGQGIRHALRTLVARELGIPASRVQVRSPSTADIPIAKATVGSDSVRELAPLIVQACALLRPQLSAVRPELVEGPATRERASGPIDADVDPDLLALVTGAAVFTADVAWPGMLHACVLRSPWRRETGSVLLGLDDEALRRVPGFVGRHDIAALDGPLLVADHPGVLPALRMAAGARWSQPDALPDVLAAVDVDAAHAAGRITRSSGHVDRIDEEPWSVDLRLDVPCAAHAGLEPRCAVARFDSSGALEVWCATQDAFYVRDVLARDHGLAPERVKVHALRIGGGFGARTIATVEREAAWAARTVGAPVKLQWSREDEFTGGFHRPPASHRVRVRLGPDGLISDWWHALSSSHVLFTNAAIPPWMQRVTDLIGDAGTTRGQHAPYAIERVRRDLTLTRLPIATGPWRGLGAGPNVLAIEAAMDAAARAAGTDPVAFRLRHLERAVSGEHLVDPARLAAVLRRVAARAAAVPVRTGTDAARKIARGVACGVYKAQGMAAAVAEVEVRPDAIVVTRLWCSHDCGRMLDPDGVRAQVEGNLVWSIGLVLSDNLPAEGGSARVESFAAYELPRFSRMPLLDIDLAESDAPSSGAGEVAIVAGAGAIFNAIVAATGRTPTRLPVRPERT